jgi:hypothetical protein
MPPLLTTCTALIKSCCCKGTQLRMAVGKLQHCPHLVAHRSCSLVGWCGLWHETDGVLLLPHQAWVRAVRSSKGCNQSKENHKTSITSTHQKQRR